MGIFKKIKQMFSKNIDYSDAVDGKIFYLSSVKSKEVKVGANINVPEGFFEVFVCKDKVCDVLLSGKFAINGANLPKTFSRMKLGKANKKGKYKKKFMADIYFISKKIEHDLEFVSYDKYVNKSEKLGNVKAHSVGLFDIEITEPDHLLKYLLSERAYVTEGLFLDLIGGLVGNYINMQLDMLYKDFLEILISPKEVNEKLNSIIEMDNYFNDYGFKMFNVRFESFNVSTKLKNRVEEVLKMQKQINQAFGQKINFDIPVLKEIVIKPEASVQEELKEKKCLYCGTVVSNSAVFCEKCGNKINN